MKRFSIFCSVLFALLFVSCANTITGSDDSTKVDTTKVDTTKVDTSKVISFIDSTGFATYNPIYSVDFARTNYQKSQTGFKVVNTSASMMTSFVNQAVVAGLIKNSSGAYVKANVGQLKADAFDSDSLKLYYLDSLRHSSSWYNPDTLFKYVKGNVAKSGFRYQFITKDSPTTTLSFIDMHSGDIIFQDRDSDGSIDFVMLIVDKVSNDYKGMYVCYQSMAGYSKLTTLDIENSLKAINYVYRPIGYSTY